MLAKLSKSSYSWDRAISEIEFALNNTVNRAIGDTIARLLFGTNQVGTVDDDLRLLLKDQQSVDRGLEEIRSSAVVKIEASNRYNTRYYDRKHKTPTRYQLGDYLMLKNVDVTSGVNKKLLPKFRGPYVVKRILDNDRYVVCDPEGNQLTQLPFEGVCSPENMKRWVREEYN